MKCVPGKAKVDMKWGNKATEGDVQCMSEREKKSTPGNKPTKINHQEWNGLFAQWKHNKKKEEESEKIKQVEMQTKTKVEHEKILTSLFDMSMIEKVVSLSQWVTVYVCLDDEQPVR